MELQPRRSCLQNESSRVPLSSGLDLAMQAWLGPLLLEEFLLPQARYSRPSWRGNKPAPHQEQLSYHLSRFCVSALLQVYCTNEHNVHIDSSTLYISIRIPPSNIRLRDSSTDIYEKISGIWKTAPDNENTDRILTDPVVFSYKLLSLECELRITKKRERTSR